MANLRFLGILVFLPFFCTGQISHEDSLINILETSAAGGRFDILMLLAAELKIKQPNKSIEYSKEARIEAHNSNDKLKVFSTYYTTISCKMCIRIFPDKDYKT